MKLSPTILLFTLLFSGSIRANQQQAIALFDAGKLELAKAQFKQILSNTAKKPVTLLYLAKIALKQNNLDQAGARIGQAEKLAPRVAEIQYFYGVINGQIAQNASIFTALGYAKKTRIGFAKAVLLGPINIKYRQALLSYHIAAPSIAGGDKDIALEQAKAIQVLDAKKGVVALFSVYSATDNENAINKLYKSLSDELKNDPDIQFLQGLFYQSKKRFPQANEIFKFVLVKAAENKKFDNAKFSAIYQLGRNSVLSKKNIAEGIEYLTLFIEKSPSTGNLPSKAWAKFRRANLYALQGKTKKARLLYKQLKKQAEDKNLLKAINKEL